MNLRDLKYLIAIAKHRHFGKAARECFVSQPTLSTQIKKLEDELGVILIERNNKQVLLTEVGEQIINKARQILKNVDEVREIATQYKDPDSGRISLAAIPTLAPYLLPHIVPSIRRQLPNMQIMLYELQTAVCVRRLENGELDAALLALPFDEGSLRHEPLFEESFVVATSPGNPLARRKHLKLMDLAGEEILLLEEGHCLRDQALDLCNKIDAREIAGFRATSLETLRQMIASGIGTTLIPKLATADKTSNQHSIRYMPFEEEPAPSRSIVLAYRDTYHRVPVLKKLASIIRDTAQPLLE
ncbi:MAG TPA: LysR substrate-binding domain-containing protein [Gammaproteobacteria bacterium]|nr:LysR substrate-binding domain-containing protein [Gammaproteobacteria bacterium]